MKSIIFVLALLVCSVSFAVPAIQCFGQANVSKENPYLLTLVNSNEAQVRSVSQSVINDGSIYISDTLNFGAQTTILVLGVVTESSDSTDLINEHVVSKVNLSLSAAGISEQNSFLECNESHGPMPEAF